MSSLTAFSLLAYPVTGGKAQRGLPWPCLSCAFHIYFKYSSAPLPNKRLLGVTFDRGAQSFPRSSSSVMESSGISESKFCRINRLILVALSCHAYSATPWTVTHQAPFSIEFSQQEYWSGQPFPSPERMDLPDPGIKPGSPEFQAGSLLSEPPGKPHPMMELLKLGVQPLPTTASNQNRPVVWTGLSTLVNRNN